MESLFCIGPSFLSGQPFFFRHLSRCMWTVTLATKLGEDMAFLQSLYVYFFLGFAGVSVAVIVEAAVVEAAAARAAAFFLWHHSVP